MARKQKSWAEKLEAARTKAAEPHRFLSLPSSVRAEENERVVIEAGWIREAGRWQRAEENTGNLSGR